MHPIQHPSYHASVRPHKVAYRIAETGEELTYLQLDDASNRGANLLRGAGLNATDHIALLVENSLDFFRICWSAQRSGVYYTAISTHLKPAEIAYILADSNSRIFFVSARLLPSLAEVLPPLLERVRVITTGERVDGYDFLDDVLAAQPNVPVADEITGQDMLYSSGTTGRPKGVQAPFRGDPLGTILPLMDVLGMRMCGMGEDTVYLSPAPLYHAAPLRFTMLCGMLGATAVIMKKFEAQTFLELVREHRITHTQVVPTMFVRMLKLPDEVRAAADVSSLRSVVHAAAPCAVEVKQAMIDWWGPILIEYYAGTEGNGVTIIDSAQWLAHRGSVGRSLVGSVKILGEDKDGEPLPPGRVGDVYFADGPEFAYLNSPEKTAESRNARGWSTLGDVGYLDDEGYLYLTDRKSYTIISGGVNVYPQETEDVLIGHPAVVDAAVFGVPNDEMGEEVKAVVQRVPGERSDAELAEDLIAYCKERLSTIKCPRTIDFIDEMPRTPTGKLVKRLLRERYWPART
jgi:acyl-CoA synthetase (AMP-forming)/AMP-acid ligase II